MDIKKLLFVTRFDKLRFDALQSLMDLKKAALNHVVFLNVIERDKVAMRRGRATKKALKSGFGKRPTSGSSTGRKPCSNRAWKWGSTSSSAVLPAR
jgi:hypothetical protein